MSRTGQRPDDAGERREEMGRDDLPWGMPAPEDEGPAGRGPSVEVHGSDVQAGPEMTDQPRAGATEPPD